MTGFAFIYSSSGSENTREQRSLGNCSISFLIEVFNTFYHRPLKVECELCPVSQKPLFSKVTVKSFGRVLLFLIHWPKAFE